MSRPVVIAVLAAVLALVGLAVVWFVFVPQPQSTQTPSASEEQRQRAENFFGGDPDRSVRDGQEMKPQW
ncbi:entry exclusion protein TrbK [Mesorhizobium sp. M1340]|uniref:entry exclusion protein TrbK n=1 Tax=Mesorhizobium sp. M1340 TaxID=2957087 RepID=UPI003337142C